MNLFANRNNYTVTLKPINIDNYFSAGQVKSVVREGSPETSHIPGSNYNTLLGIIPAGTGLKIYPLVNMDKSQDFAGGGVLPETGGSGIVTLS